MVRRWGIPDRDPYTPTALAHPMIDPHRLLEAEVVKPLKPLVAKTRDRGPARRGGRTTQDKARKA